MLAEGPVLDAHLTKSLEISPGKHSVQLVLNGYKDQVGEISPRMGYKLAVEVSMEK
jgi:hypothetical protein